LGEECLEAVILYGFMDKGFKDLGFDGLLLDIYD
jgi:hypothetical protein